MCTFNAWIVYDLGCKSRQLKACAKGVNVSGFCLKQQSGVLCVQHVRFSTETAGRVEQAENQTSDAEQSGGGKRLFFFF